MKKIVAQLKAVGLAAVISMVFCAGAQSAVIASFDVNGQAGSTQEGYTALTTNAGGLGSATVNGITVTITQAVAERARTDKRGWFANNPDDPEWDLYRDFSFGGTVAADAIKVTISGLSANTAYDFRWYHYDSWPGFFQTMSVYQDDTTGDALFTASYTVDTDPHTTGNSLFTATSDGTGTIDLVTSIEEGSRFNGLDVIPEPATSGLLLLGAVAGLGLLRRKLYG